MQESGTGRNSTWSYVRLESAFEGKAEVGCRGGQVVYDPTRTLHHTEPGVRLFNLKYLKFQELFSVADLFPWADGYCPYLIPGDLV
jgi:hypothetical protein